MSKNERERSRQAKIHANGSPEKQTAGIPGRKKSEGYLRGRLWVVLVISVLSLGVLGAGLRYLEQDSAKQNQLRANQRSLLSSINPFVISPSPTPTPQLSKEYIYGGSRLLAVEDAGANAAPPADLAVWRPSSGVWWVLGGPGSQQTAHQWGTSGDIPVPGDFDGDGKTDFSIFRPSTGQWWVVRSSDDTSYAVSFGQSGDVTVPADFDGDGKTDHAVFRPSTQTWYITRSSDAGTTYQQFGLSTDTPAPADYDGDGKADISVYRSSDTTFYTLLSSSGTLEMVDIGTTGTPVSGDFDGDGKANYAVMNGNSWVIMNGALTATSSVTWQNSGDIPVQNDYDGDGIVDIAVWRDSNGTWYIRQSSKLGQQDELRTQQWGMSGDIPVPAYYRR
jgi:hypothetical protein